MALYRDHFNFQISGSDLAPKLVFLHGLMGSWVNWKRVISSLQDRFQIFAFDQRGHGRSFHPEQGYSPEDYAQDLFRLTEELGWTQFALVGHSMGGRNAICFTSRFPHRVSKLVVEDIGPEARPQAEASYRELLAQIPTPFASKRAAKEFFLNEFPRIRWGREPAANLGAFLLMNIEEKPDARADWRFFKPGILESVRLGRGHEHWWEWESVNCPSLLIRGAESEELSRECFQEMLRRNPKSQGVEIDNAGHWVHSEQPQEFIRILSDFL